MTLEEIKDQVAKERGRKSFYTLFCLTLEPSKQIEIVNEVCKRYATECVKVERNKTIEEAKDLLSHCGFLPEDYNGAIIWKVLNSLKV